MNGLKMKEPSYKWWALSCTTFGALLISINANMMMVALPTIAGSFQAKMDQVVWAVMVYTLTITVCVPLVGRVADMFGRKRFYLLGFYIFLAGSLMCGVSASCLQLIASRFVQAVGASLIMANSSAILTDAFPRYELGKALGLNMTAISLGMIVGPAIGGVLTQYSWRLNFFFNIPLGIIGAVWALLQLREMGMLSREKRFDWAGAGTLSAGLFLILFVLTKGNEYGWLSSPTIIMSIGGVLFLAAFVYIENLSSHPMLDLRLLKDRFLAASFAASLLNGLVQGAIIFLLTFYFQSIRGFSPLYTGVLFIPFAVSMFVFSPLCGSLSDYIGSRGLSSAGFLVRAASYYGLSQIGTGTMVSSVVLLSIISGLGTALFISPNSKGIMETVPPDHRGVASGLRIMMNNGGMVASIALAVAITGATGISAGGDFHGVYSSLDFLDGMHRTFLVFALISIPGAIVSYVRGNSRRLKADHSMAGSE